MCTYKMSFIALFVIGMCNIYIYIYIKNIETRDYSETSFVKIKQNCHFVFIPLYYGFVVSNMFITAPIMPINSVGCV